MKKRKDYKKPTVQVIRLQQGGMLMTSGVEASRSSYGTADESEGTIQTWD